MPTIPVGPDSDLELQQIADALGKSKKVVVVTGAGISTNCGIPDFRSEHGLYSIIQAQYEAALRNPPWEQSNTFDIDDRPKKKRRQWYYEVVAPDGKVVDVIDEELQPSKEEPRRSSRSRSTNTTNSRSSTPKSTESSLTSLSSTTPELPDNVFQDSTELSLDADSSILSQTCSEKLESSTQTTTGSARLSRTTSDISTTTRTLPNLKGRDLFDCRIWADPFSTSVFYMFISSLREKIEKVKSTTETHRLLRVLRDGGRLVRNYTQNIDMLEEREGLNQDLERGPGTKGRFNARIKKEARESGVSNDINQIGGCESVPLHGSLQRLRCNLCGKPSSWDDPEIKATMLSGSAPDCARCTENHSHRTSRGRRGLAIGRLRPDIVLYGEDHPHSNLISPIVTHDLGLGPDVLLIMGTSLKVHGLKVLIREFAKAVHTKGGKVVFVNQTKPSDSIWGDFIDYWVEWDCDEWVMDLRDRREDIWSGTMEEKQKDPTDTKRWRPQALRDDKTNGAYLTFKILDTLSKAPDVDGKLASRFLYWQPARLPSRLSDVKLPESQKKVPQKKGQATKKTKPAAPPKKPATKPKSNKRKSQPEDKEDKNNVAYLVGKIWEDLRKKAPTLSAPPPELRLPFSKFVSNAPNWYTPFAFDAKSNHIPNLGGSPWPLDKMNLVTHPPCGSTIPIHTPKGKPKTEERPKVRHSYGTRASGRFSNAETIVVDSEDIVEEHDDTIVVADDPMTPASKRIKRSCSIGALVSSSPEEWHDAPEVMT
ncbi:hypothetical protein EG329_003094 [Mollisiaceae sp. DMI_Dod_QoI]|nr:hypothetical protein EG329_003094 [Helotiales sp. DMI_Dod_QoI]